MNTTREITQAAEGPDCKPEVMLIGPDASVPREVAGTLRDSGRFDVIGMAEGTHEAAAIAARMQPDVILFTMAAGEAAIARKLGSLLESAPDAKIVILAPDEDYERGLEALRAGAAGFLSEPFDRAALERMLMGVLAGEAAISRRFATWLSARVREAPARRIGMRPVKSPLTTREWEVLDLFSAGISKPAIARDLSVTVGTVRTHLRSLARKLSIHGDESVLAGGLPRTRARAQD